MSGRVHRFARFIRTHQYKLYDDGNLFDVNADPEEQSPFEASTDNEERSTVRAQLKPIFTQMVK